MKANVGFLDQFIRLFLGVVAIGMAIANVFVAPWDMIIGAVGAVMLLTGLVKFCPAYILVGLNTCGKETGADSAH
ncbi:MAG: DUF2892 domain-containing protein [Pseudomonadota bacterium]